MSTNCKTVSLRTRKIKNGEQLSFYLDYYPGYRDESTMKTMRHESLGIYIYAKPKSQREKDYNDRMREKAEALRCRRYESIVNERYDFFDRDKMKGDFLAYFKQKADKKNCKWQHVYKHFARFCNDKCRFDEINVDLCNKFREYLLSAPQTIHTEHKLHINSVAGYWSTFRADMDCRSWRRDLKADQEILGLLLVMLKDITPKHDSKLQMLIENLRDKFAHPINGENKKVLVFTAFSDTAEYLYSNLAPAIAEKAHLHTGLVTGDGSKSTVKGIKADFNNVLTLFSPVSKEADKLLPHIHEQIDVLIATDCISEGQNLQDCDYLINYDIHWNPVRIIQRFGRVDRIGSRNDVIQLVNYWSDIELDDYLRLKGRVEARMAGMDITGAGSGNVLLSNEEQADLDYRKQQLERLQEEVVDIEDMDTGINIMDLGLNEFRLDLLAYMKENPDIEHTPYGMSAVVPATDVAKPGVIFILKNRNNAINIGKQNLLHPFYMVYLFDEGEAIINHLSPKRLLDIMRLSCKGRIEPILDLCHVFNKETKGGKQMQHYSELLQKAVATIVAQKEENDLESLFSFGETTALVGDIAGLDDFELICFLVIKEGGARG